jgi:hypothetical protein
MKYAAITLNTLAVLVLIWVLTGLIAMTGSRLPQGRWSVPEVKPLTDNDVDGQSETLQSLKVLNAVSAKEVPAEKSSSTPLSGLIALPASTAQDAKNRALPQRQVTLLMKDDSGFSAMVDGVLVRSGQLLEREGRVLSVSEGQVIVAEKNGKQTLTVSVDSLRVGALRTGTFLTTEGGAVRSVSSPQAKVE